MCKFDARLPVKKGRVRMELPTLKISSISATPVNVPLVRPITTATHTIPTAPLVLIELETDARVNGCAYLFGYTKAAIKPLVAMLDELSAMLSGKAVAPFDIMRELEKTFRLLGKQGILGMAISGVDMALWDAMGKAMDTSVAELLGGSLAPIPAYDSYGIVDPERDRPELEASLAAGFKAIKIKLGAGDLALDVATLKGVREIIGPDIRLMADFNQSLTVPEAKRRIARFTEFDLDWIEEPVPAEDLAGHARVRDGSPIPVQTGENWWFPEDAARAVQAGACDFAMPDLMKIGGITGWVQAAGHLAGASLPVSSHIFVEASAHALAVTKGAHLLEYLDLASAVLKEPYMVQDGEVAPRGPGIGIEFDRLAVDTFKV